MPAWRKILCAVDLSEPSRVALREAAALARLSGAALTVLHVFPAPSPSMISVTDPLAPSAEDIEARVAESLEADLAPWKEEAARIAERDVETALVPGKAAERIVEFARAGGFDLIVVATHGRTGVRRLVLGSVAEHVVRAATVPVLVARSATQGA